MAAPWRALSNTTTLLFRLHSKPLPPRALLCRQLESAIPFRPRLLSTSTRQHAAKKISPATKVPRSSSKRIRNPASGSYKSFAQTLAERSEPILLYQSASYTVYMAGCYSVGLLILTWVAYTANFIHAWNPTIMGPYLKVGYSVFLGIAGGLGMIYMMKPFRIIQSIQAIPIVAKNPQTTLHLQIESYRMFPGIRPKTISIPVNDIRLSQPIFQDRSNADYHKLLETRQIEAEAIRKLKQGNYLLLPFRQLGFHLSKAFRSLKHVFTKNPFIYLRAKGFSWSWKLDKETGWALEDGRALDRIIRSRVTA